MYISRHIGIYGSQLNLTFGPSLILLINSLDMCRITETALNRSCLMAGAVETM